MREMKVIRIGSGHAHEGVFVNGSGGICSVVYQLRQPQQL